MKVFVQPTLSSTSVLAFPAPFKATAWISGEGNYALPNKLCVELWSNFSPDGWAGVELQEVATPDVFGCPFSTTLRKFEIELSTNSLGQGWYEFTGRTKVCSTPSTDWIWWSEKEGQNGKVFISRTLEGNEEGRLEDIFCDKNSWAEQNITHHVSNHWYVSRSTTWIHEQPSFINFGPLKNMVRYLGLHRFSPYWIAPTTGIHKLDIQAKDVLYLLIQQSCGHFIVLIPLTFENSMTTLCSDENGNLILKTINESGEDKIARLVIARGKDPHFLTTSSMDFAKKIIGSSDTIIKSTNHPRDLFYYDKLGYCTWNAFYDKVNHESVTEVLQSLNNSNVSVGYIIIDDGWQKTSPKKQLQSFEAKRDDFPMGLKYFINDVKKKFPHLHHFGVWHSLWGYWNGIDPESELGSRYTIESIDCGKDIISKDDVYRFYDEFYKFLKDQGVDLVKVDSQASFDLLPTRETRLRLFRNKYQEALLANSTRYFESRLIYCMAHSPAIHFHLIKSQNSRQSEKSRKQAQPLFRNSDDFFPDSRDSHAWHIYTNAINNMWTRCLGSIPDWDMFESNHMLGDLHAAARAISGGPVYITDKPNQHNLHLLNRLVAKTPLSSRILRSNRPALPSLRNLFSDPTKDEQILKISNVNGCIGVLGLFNFTQHALIDTISSMDIYWFPKSIQSLDVEFVVFFHIQQNLRVIPITERETGFFIYLESQKFDIATFAPVDIYPSFPVPVDHQVPQVKVACLGLLDKYNGSRAVSSSGFRNKQNSSELQSISYAGKKQDIIYHITLVALGECGLYVSSNSACSLSEDSFRVFLHNHKSHLVQDIHYNKVKNLLYFQVPNISVPVDGPIYQEENIEIDVHISFWHNLL